MTKAQELEILREAARKLGKDSYCGPLLEMLIPQLAQDMLADIMPEFDLRKANAECIAEREACKKECEAMKADAKKAAASIYQENVRDVAAMKARAASALEDIAARLR